MQIISLRWTPLAKDVISLKVKNLKEQLKKKKEKSFNYQTLPKFAFHTWNKDAYICTFIVQEQQIMWRSPKRKATPDSK